MVGALGFEPINLPVKSRLLYPVELYSRLKSKRRIFNRDTKTCSIIQNNIKSSLSFKPHVKAVQFRDFVCIDRRCDQLCENGVHDMSILVFNIPHCPRRLIHGKGGNQSPWLISKPILSPWNPFGNSQFSCKVCGMSEIPCSPPEYCRFSCGYCIERKLSWYEYSNSVFKNGGLGGTRTPTTQRSTHFKCAASTNSATRPFYSSF